MQTTSLNESTDIETAAPCRTGPALSPRVRRLVLGINLLWAGYWAYRCLGGVDWLLLLHPHRWAHFEIGRYLAVCVTELCFPAVALVWLAGAVALVWGRAWGWLTSFVFATLALFVSVYVVLLCGSMAAEEGWRGFYSAEILYAGAAVLVMGSLLYIRHDYVKPGELHER